MSRIKPKLEFLAHVQGGTSLPYDRVHLTPEEFAEATRDASDGLRGLLPAGLAKTLAWTDVPLNWWDTGDAGARSMETASGYFFVCVDKDSWRCRKFSDWTDGSSSSSSSSWSVSSSSSRSSISDTSMSSPSSWSQTSVSSSSSSSVTTKSSSSSS